METSSHHRLSPSLNGYSVQSDGKVLNTEDNIDICH